MKKKFLEQHLFRKGTKVYAILDGASVPDLPIKLYESGAQNLCLYRGELEPDVAFVAPYLVEMVQGIPFTDLILEEGWGQHWGIFLHSFYNLEQIRKSLRRFITVYDESGKPMLFRFYDPRVLNIYLPTCNSEELKTFFYQIETFFSESTDGNILHRFSVEDSKLKKTDFQTVE